MELIPAADRKVKGSFNGTLRIERTLRVRDAPAMAHS